MGGNRNRELIKNTVIIALGQICTKFLWMLILPVYTQVLKPEEFGLFDLYSTYWMLLGFIIFLQVEQGIFRFLIEAGQDETEQRAIISTGFLGVLFNSAVFAVIFVLIGSFVDDPYKYFLLAITLASSWSGFLLQICRGLGDNKTYAVGGVICAAINLSCNVIFVFWLRIGVNGLFYGAFFGNLVCALFIVFAKRLWKYVRIYSINKVILWHLLKYCLPLIPNSISWWCVYASDRSITAVMLGTAANGVLAVANRFSTVLSSVYNMFHLSWVESASRHIYDPDAQRYFFRVINTVFRFFFSLFIVVLPVFSLCFPYIIGQGYEESYVLFPMYLGAAMLNVVQGLYSVVYIAKKETKELAKTTVISAVVNVFVYIVLIKSCGLLAAGLSTAIAYAVVTIWRYFDVQKYIRVRLESKLLMSACVVSMIVLYVYYRKSLIENSILLIFMVLYSILINRKAFKIMHNKIHRKTVAS